MPSFSKSSMKKLETCHQDLVTLFLLIIKYFNCTIVSGQRLPEEQFKLFKKGRELRDDKWVKVGNVVTYKDGYEKISRHNILPLSEAIDAVPWPVQWNNVNRMRYFVGYVKGQAQLLYDFGTIEHQIITGMDWDNDTILTDQRFNDIPHFQLKK